MKKYKLHSYKFYYISGAITLFVSVLVCALCLSLTLIYSDNQTWGWISFGLMICSIPFVFFAIYLLKKGNFLKLNKVLAENKKKNDLLNK
jgi:hypothetical protein